MINRMMLYLPEQLPDQPSYLHMYESIIFVGKSYKIDGLTY